MYASIEAINSILQFLVSSVLKTSLLYPDARRDRHTSRTPRRVVLLHAPSDIDNELCGEFRKHLAVLEHQGQISTFSAPAPGTLVMDAFTAAIAAADVVLVLLSSDLLADPECRARIELALLTRKHVIPVVARVCDWHASEFGDRQALPESGRAVTEWGITAVARDSAWQEVVSGLRRLLRLLPTSF